jgi:hypothetical protein
MNSIEDLFGSRISRAVLFLTLAFPAMGSFAAGGLDFDKTFNDKGEPRTMHYRAIYSLNGTNHQVEVWRDRDQRLKRRTDDTIETFIFKPAMETEWRMVVLDLKRKIRTDIDRTNLYRIGHFTDWFSLSHSLTRPTGQYRLKALDKPMAGETPVAPCRWYSMTRSGWESKICWSNAMRLPLLVLGPDETVQWRVTEFDSKPIALIAYQINDHGFVRNDANDDIQAD